VEPEQIAKYPDRLKKENFREIALGSFDGPKGVMPFT
jgi:hypothetical protein